VLAIWPAVLAPIACIARAHLQRLTSGQTLDTNGLVHEAWMKLVERSRVDWQDRVHFLAVASRAMRQVVVDYARRRRAGKRGGGARALELDEASPAVQDQSARNPRFVRVV
jgi:RNA polymerase sigma factor (TIGR02999 family)